MRQTRRGNGEIMAHKDGTENLIPQNRRTKEEQKEIARKGGIASGEARRKKRQMREILGSIEKMPAPSKIVAMFKKNGLDVPEGITMEEALAYSMLLHSIKGDGRILSLLFDVTGDKRSDQLKEKEIELKEQMAKDTKQEALERLDAILGSLRETAYADTDTQTE